MFLRGGLEFYIFKINHLPWFCILDFCLGRHRTFWLAKERLYDATAHLFVHSAGVIIFLTKPTNASYYFWGVLVVLLASFKLHVSTRMWDGIWENSVINHSFSKLVLGRRPKEGCFQNRYVNLQGNCINLRRILFKSKFLAPKPVII